MNFRRLVILTLVLLGSVAYAGPKQKMAVLGIEAIIGANGQIDPQDVQFAKELTKELRVRVNNSKDYELTKEQRELSDEKLMNGCSNEAAACMSTIGAGIGADFVLFGRIENTKSGYKVSLKLVNVNKKQQVTSDPNVEIRTADTRGVGLSNWVRDRFRKLTGETADGKLTITIAGATTGTVYVGKDRDPKGQLNGGSITLTLPEGRHKVVVEADGFDLWEQEVTVSAEKPTELTPTVKKKDKGEPGEGGTGTTGGDNLISTTGTVSTAGKSNKTIWKVAAGVGFAGAAAGTVFIGYSYMKMKDFDGTLAMGSSFDGRTTGTVTQDDCGGRFDGTNASSNQDKFDAACSAKDRMKWLVPTTIGFAAIGTGALIYVLMSKDGKEEERPANAGRRAKKRNFLVTPVVSPDGSGATLRFDW